MYGIYYIGFHILDTQYYVMSVFTPEILNSRHSFKLLRIDVYLGQALSSLLVDIC